MNHPEKREDEVVDHLVAAFRYVVEPNIGKTIPRNLCFQLSTAAAEAVRSMGVQARAVAVDCTFTDFRNRAEAGTPRGSGAHAVVATTNFLVDLTFRQFDEFLVGPDVLVKRLAGGWGGRLIAVDPAVTWRVTYDDRTSDARLRSAQEGLDVGDLVERLVAAPVHLLPVRPVRVARAERNELCPCGSGSKFKKCCEPHTA